MLRLFTNTPLALNSTIFLSEEQIHYLLHVMRQRAGDTLLLFNGHDGEWQGHLTELTKKTASVCLDKQTRPQTSDPKLILCPALIKKENMDLVFQKATELGVTDIYPLITERTVVSRLNSERATLILQEASEQCERLSIPTLHPVQKLPTFLSQLSPEITPVCLSERGQTSDSFTPQTTYAFCIGPEGGWTSSELDLFSRNQTLFWHLGNTILRAETASIVALATYQFGLNLHHK